MDSRSNFKNHPPGRIEDQPEAQKLDELVDGLPPSRREAFLDYMAQGGYTLAEVSVILGKPLHEINELVLQARIKASRHGNTWIVSPEELCRIRRQACRAVED
jgi:DNA-directed RNA polymerase specialized sigma24 family protein